MVAAGACRSGTAPQPEAGADVRLSDARVLRDATATPLAVDFTVGDCPSFADGPSCRGRAPLTVQFVPVTTGTVTKYLWVFGDGTEASSIGAPVHVYSFPGKYKVTLVGGGPDGSAMRERTDFVVVLSNGPGESCDVDQQCEVGLMCVCGSAANPRCTAAFARGLCAASCKDTECREGESCADLSQGAPDAGEPWQQPLCLRRCDREEDCGAPLRCRDLPARNTDAGWLRGCFPDYPVAAGGRCRGADGQLQSEICVTGRCLDLGAEGVCSLDCASSPCPPSMGCADLTGGRVICLARCSPTVTCDDPLLACQGPNAGPLGFTLHSGTPAGSFCAPRRCASSDDCGPAGSCSTSATGGHCVRR
jgi:PKD repeat protein